MCGMLPGLCDPLDVESESWVSLREAMSRTHRSRPTILRWVKAGLVRTIDRVGARVYCAEDLADAEAEMHRRQLATRRVQQGDA